MPSQPRALPSVEKPWLRFYTEAQRNAHVPALGMFDYLYEQNRGHLSDTALNYFGRKMTYGTLFRQIDTAAKAFRALGIGEGDIVPVVSLTCPPAVIAFYALNRIGAVPDFLNVLASEAELTGFFREAEAKVLLTLDLFAPKVLRAAAKGKERVVVFSLGEEMPPVTRLGFSYKTRKLDRSCLRDPRVLTWKPFLAGARGQEEITLRKNDSTLSCFGHTGGTTGVPKGVMLSDRAFNTVAFYYGLCMEHSRGDVFLSVMIPYVVYSEIINLHMPLTLGFETVLIPKFDAGKWHEYIRKYRPNHCGIIPAYASALLADEKLRRWTFPASGRSAWAARA